MRVTAGGFCSWALNIPTSTFPLSTCIRGIFPLFLCDYLRWPAKSVYQRRPVGFVQLSIVVTAVLLLEFLLAPLESKQQLHWSRK